VKSEAAHAGAGFEDLERRSCIVMVVFSGTGGVEIKE
jgi:hypothetical protein